MASPRLLKRAIDPTEVTRIEKALGQSITRQQEVAKESDVITRELRKFIDSEQGQLAGEVGDRVARERTSEPRFDGTGPRPVQQQQRQRQETFIGPEGMRTHAVNEPNEAINIFKATELHRDGASARQIWEQTGVIYGQDGHRRMEIPDVDMQYNRSLMDNLLVNGPGAHVRLDTLIKHDGIREIYPEVFNTRVRVISRPESFVARVQTKTAEGRPVIEVNHGYFKDLSADEQSAVILHEIQHIVQSTEGLPAGTNPNYEALRWLEKNMPEDMLQHIPTGPDPVGQMHQLTMDKLNELLPRFGQLDEVEKRLFNTLVQNERLLGLAKRNGQLAYYRNIGEVEAFDVEARLADARKGEQIGFPPALIRAIEEQEELTSTPGQAASTSEARGRRPGGRTTDPRRLPSLLPDGIHYDNNGFPFKVTNRRIVRMSDEEAEEAILNAPIKQEEIDESVLIQRARQESQERSRKARQTKIDNEKRERQQKELEEFRSSSEFQRLQEQSLGRVQRAREQRFRESPEVQDLQRQNLNRSRTALGQDPEEAPATPAPTQEPSQPGGNFHEGDFEKKKKAAVARGKAKRERKEQESRESLTARQQEQFDEARLAAENEVFTAQRDSVFEVATMADMDDVGLFEDMKGFLDEVNALVADGKLPQARAQSLIDFYLERVGQAGKNEAMEEMLQRQPTPSQQQQAQAQAGTLYRGLKPNGRPRGYPGEFYTELEGLAGRYAGADGSIITREELPQSPFNVDDVADMPEAERTQMLEEFREFMVQRHPNVPEEELIGPGQSEYAYLDQVLGEPFETDFIYPTKDDVDFLRSKGFDSVFFGQEGGEQVNSWFIFDDAAPARQATPQQQQQANAGAARGSPSMAQDPEELDSATPVTRDHLINYGDDAMSPWLLEDGSAVLTGGDHIAYAHAFGYKDYEPFMEATNAIRAVFHKTGTIDGMSTAPSFVSLHIVDGQRLTEAQFRTVREFVEANNAEVILGRTIKREGRASDTPPFERVSLDQIPVDSTNNRQATPVQQQQARDVRGGITGDTDPRFAQRAEEAVLRQLETKITSLSDTELSDRYQSLLDVVTESDLPELEILGREMRSRGFLSEGPSPVLTSEDEGILKDLSRVSTLSKEERQAQIRELSDEELRSKFRNSNRELEFIFDPKLLEKMKEDLQPFIDEMKRRGMIGRVK